MTITQSLFDRLIREEIAISAKMISDEGRPAVEFSTWPEPTLDAPTLRALAEGLRTGLFRYVYRRAGWYRVEVA